MTRRPSALILFACLLAAPAWAEDNAYIPDVWPEDNVRDPWQPERALQMTGHHGLTGFGTMIDGRVPAPFLSVPDREIPGGSWAGRLTLRGSYVQRWRKLKGYQGAYRLREESYAMTTQHGITVRGLDLSVGVPYTWERTRFLVDGAPDPSSDRDQAAGDVFVAGKIGLRIPKFIFGSWAIAGFSVYTTGRIPTHTSVSRDAEVEWGAAVTGPYGYSFRYNGNLGILHREGGVKAIAFRMGGSAVPVANEALTVRGFFHMDGLQNEGTHRPRIDLQAGVQVLLHELVQLELSGRVRVVEDEFVDPQMKRDLRNFYNDSIRGIRDEGSFEVTFGVGIIL